MRFDRGGVGALLLFLLSSMPAHAESEGPGNRAGAPEGPTFRAPVPPPHSPLELGFETVAAVRGSNATVRYTTARVLLIAGVSLRYFVSERVAIGITGGFLLRDTAGRGFGAERGPLLLGTVAYAAPMGNHAFFVPTLQLGGYIGWKEAATATSSATGSGVDLRTGGVMLRVGLGFAFPINHAFSITARPELIWTHGSTSNDGTPDDPLAGFGSESRAPGREPGAVNEVHGAMSLGAAYRF